MSYLARGYVSLHAVPFSVSRQVAWTISRELEAEAHIAWLPQPAMTSHVHGCIEWSGGASVGAGLASALAGWRQLWFEVSQEPTLGVDGSIWFHTPSLGLLHRSTDASGNLMVSENQLRLATETYGRNAKQLREQLGILLAEPWMAELEPLRAGAAANRAVWLAG